MVNNRRSVVRQGLADRVVKTDGLPAELWYANLYNFSPVLFDIFGVLAVVDMMPRVEYQFLTRMKVK